jgi:putative adhesin
MTETWKIESPEQITIGDGARSLRLHAVAGRVNIIGTDGPATLEVTKVSGPPLHVEFDGGELTIRHGEFSGPQLLGMLFGPRRTEVHLSLALPPDALVDVRVVSGPVVISNFHERVAVKGVSGEITLAGVHGAARVATVSGAITAEQVTGDLAVKAISGAITVIAGAGGAITLSAVSGAITVDLEDPLPKSVILQCVSGAMTVRLPHDPDVTVDVSTSNGRAVSAFPEVTVSGARSSQRMHGQVGSGTARLTGKTVSGAVSLLRRNPEEDPWDRGVEDERPDDRRPDTPENGENSEDAR